MAHTQTRIYIDTTTNPDLGVSIGDVKSVLGELSNDVGNLCQSAKINKWARCKPIRYYTYVNGTKIPYFGLLTDEMRKGPQIDLQDEGIYYGLEVRIPEIDQELNTWPDLHTASFDYMQPRGLAYNEVFRLRDFEEYVHNANPNPYANFGTDGNVVGFYNYVNGITGITVGYSATNHLYGVDFTEMLVNPGQESLDTVLSQTYPCIIIGKDNTHYMTALGFEDDANHAPRPLRYQNAYVSGTWVADTSKDVYGGAHSSGAPWTSPQSGLSVTIILVRTSYTDANGVYLDSTRTQNLKTHWFECTPGSALIAPSKPVPVPQATGLTLSLVQFTNGITVSATSISYDPTSDIVTVTLDYSGTPVGTGSFTAYVDTTIGAGSGPRKTTSGSVDFHRVMIVTYQGLEDNFGIVYNPIQPTTRSVTISVETHDGSATNTSTQYFTLAL